MKTKTLIATLVFALTGITSGIAQEMNWGVKAGANYANLESNINSDPVFGLHAGLLAEMKLSPNFSIQPELLYSMEGAKAEINYNEEDFFLESEQKIKLGYLNLPVMMKYFVTSGLSLQAGPQLGYLLSAENEYKISSRIDDMEFNESGTEDIKDELKKISLGLNFGLGYEFSNNFLLQARYHLGLTDISDYEEDPEDFEGELDELKNSSFQVSVGYKF